MKLQFIVFWCLTGDFEAYYKTDENLETSDIKEPISHETVKKLIASKPNVHIERGESKNNIIYFF